MASPPTTEEVHALGSLGFAGMGNSNALVGMGHLSNTEDLLRLLAGYARNQAGMGSFGAAGGANNMNGASPAP